MLAVVMRIWLACSGTTVSLCPTQTVQQRGAAVIKARKLSSAMSAAKAIADHIRDIWFGTPEVRVLICTGLSFWIEKNAIKPVGFIS
jgi:hypothetical protein